MKTKMSKKRLSQILIGGVMIVILSFVLLSPAMAEEEEVLGVDVSHIQVVDPHEDEDDVMDEVDDGESLIKELEDKILFLENQRKSTYIMVKEAPVFEAPSSNSKQVGKYSISSVVRVNETTDDGIWYKNEKGYFKTFNCISLIAAETKDGFIKSSDGENKKTLNNADKTIVGKSNMNLNQIKTLLKGSAMEDCAQTILDVENQYNLNAFFIISVAYVETQLGKTGVGKSKNNCYGLTKRGGGFQTFTYKKDSVKTFGDTINRLYVKNGRTTIEKVNSLYCPNTTKWSTDVRKTMNKFYKSLT